MLNASYALHELDASKFEPSPEEGGPDPVKEGNRPCGQDSEYRVEACS